MKSLLIALLLSTLTASVEPHEPVQPLDPATATSPDKAFFAATRLTPDDKYIWKADLDFTRLVIFPLKNGDQFGRLYARHDIGGRFVAHLQWSPDSKFVVLTTTSSGGHRPYHFQSFVFCVADKSLRYMDSSIGMVLDSEFYFEEPDVAVMTVRAGSRDPLDPEGHKTVKIALHEAIKKMKKIQ